MSLLYRYKQYFRSKVLRDEGALGAVNIVARIEIAKFWAVAVLIGWLTSYFQQPWPAIGIVVAIAVAVGSAVFIFGLLLELRARAADKFYDLFTRKHLSREYRDSDR